MDPQYVGEILVLPMKFERSTVSQPEFSIKSSYTSLWSLQIISVRNFVLMFLCKCFLRTGLQILTPTFLITDYDAQLDEEQPELAWGTEAVVTYSKHRK